MDELATREQIAAAIAYENLHVPALFRQWAPRVLDAAGVKAGQAVLDVACGTGVLAREASARVGGGGSVVGIDSDPGMLTVAAQRAPDVGWRQCAAECLPFDDDSFDAVVSQFGLMFFTDPGRAVGEMMRVARPGRRVAVAVWEDLERSAAYPAEVELVERRAGSRAADALRAPFRMGNPDTLRTLFTDAGLMNVEVTTCTGTARFPSVRAMVEADLRGWLPVMGVELDDDLIGAILEEAEEVLAQHVTADGQAVFNAPAHLVVAEKRNKQVPLTIT